MKDIGEVRRGLGRIRNALGEIVSPRPPRFPGTVTLVSRPDLVDLVEAANPAPRPDRRDLGDLCRTLDGAVVTEGVEALAWYHPFHASPDEWGIYVPQTSIHYVAKRWFNPRMHRPHRLKLALETLLAHEVIHHLCEYAVAQYELLLAAPCWQPARKRLRAANFEWFHTEEALANAHCIRRAEQSESPAVVRQVHEALLQSPPGYRDFPAAVSDEGFEDHLLEVLRHNVGVPAIDLKAGLLEPGFDARSIYPDVDDALAGCPIRLIDDTALFGLPPVSPRIITCIPRIQETVKFQRMLRKLDPRRQEEWARVKADLTNDVPRHPKFEKLKGSMGGLFSIRLGEGFRAHLRPTVTGVWEAIEVGSHTAMRHG